MSVFMAEVPVNDEKAMESFQDMMNDIQNETNEHIQKLAQELDVSDACAMDVWYLRGRSRHTQKLEDRLIELHKNGTPPNMCEFGN